MKPDMLDRYVPLFEPPEQPLEGFYQLIDRKRRNRRIGALVLVAVMALAAIAALRASTREGAMRVPADETISPSTSRTSTRWRTTSRCLVSRDTGLRAVTESSSWVRAVIGVPAEPSSHTPSRAEMSALRVRHCGAPTSTAQGFRRSTTAWCM